MEDNASNLVRTTLETLGVKPTEDELLLITEGYRSILGSMSTLHEVAVNDVEPLTIPRLPTNMGSVDAWAG